MSVRHERAADRAQSSGARERILVAATEQFAAKGLAGARVDEIARAARVNKQLVYYYYGGKLELYNQVLGQMVEESRHKIEAEATCKTLTARLKGSGMRWDSDNAEAIMALEALTQSDQWDLYWKSQLRPTG